VTTGSATQGYAIRVMLSDGSGGLATGIPFSSGGAQPTSVKVADFNGDGKADIAVANSNTVAVLLNTTITLPVNRPPVADAGADQAADEGSVVQFDGTGSSDPDGDSLTYAWDFGDGALGTGSEPVHAYSDNGIYSVVLTVDDGNGGSHSDTMQVVVANVNPTATLSNSGPVDEGSPVTISFSNPFDPSSADTAASFRYGFALSPNALPANYADAGNDLSGAFTFPDNGIFQVYGRIFDKDGGATTYSTQVTVVNVAPTVKITGPNVTVPGNDAFLTTQDLFRVAITDPGALDTFTGTVSFGDGT
jgi:PKD repeat protein